jgi:hypothetical protein
LANRTSAATAAFLAATNTACFATIHRMSFPDDAEPEYWHERAQEARALADQMNDPEAKRMMLEIANGYEWLAKRAETKAAKS